MAKYQQTATFAVGESETDSITTNERTLVGLIITGSVITASEVTFLVSMDDSSFYPLYNDESTEVSLTTGSYARSYSTNPLEFSGWKFIKAREGNSASAVNQATYDEGVIFVLDSM